MVEWIILAGSVILSAWMFNILPFVGGLIIFFLSRRERKTVEKAESDGDSNPLWYHAGMGIVVLALLLLLILSAGLTVVGESNMIQISNRIAGK